MFLYEHRGAVFWIARLRDDSESVMVNPRASIPLSRRNSTKSTKSTLKIQREINRIATRGFGRLLSARARTELPDGGIKRRLSRFYFRALTRNLLGVTYRCD